MRRCQVATAIGNDRQTNDSAISEGYGIVEVMHSAFGGQRPQRTATGGQPRGTAIFLVDELLGLCDIDALFH